MDAIHLGDTEADNVSNFATDVEADLLRNCAIFSCEDLHSCGDSTITDLYLE